MCIFRDEWGKFFIGFVRILPRMSPFAPEALAMKEAMNVATNLSVNNMIFLNKVIKI